MKIKRFNENTSKFVDPVMDIIEFKEKCNGKIPNNVLSILKSIENEFTHQTTEFKTYRVVEFTDERGSRYDVICYVNAVSQDHARIKASTLLNNMEIISTGWYNAYPATKNEIKDKKAEIRREILKLNKKLEIYNNIF